MSDNQLKNTYSLIGLFKANATDFIKYYEDGHATEETPKEVIDIANERFIARQNKDWATSDILRDKLSELGYLVKDSKDGYELIKK